MLRFSVAGPVKTRCEAAFSSEKSPSVASTHGKTKRQYAPGRSMVIETPEAVAVAAADITTVVELVTEVMVVLAGMPVPVILRPTSWVSNAAPPLVSVVLD